MGDNESAIMQLYARTHPNDLYRMGDRSYAGMNFVPEKAAVEEVKAEVASLLKATDDPVETGVLRNILLSLDFREPYMPTGDILWGVFAHLVMDGIHRDHLRSFFCSSLELLRASEDMMFSEWPPVVKVGAYMGAVGCLGILSSVREHLEREDDAGGALRALDELAEYVSSLRDRFSCDGVEEGDYTQVFPFLEAHDRHVGRADIYPSILSDMYGFYEDPEKIEAMARKWLDEELSLFREARSGLAGLMGAGDDPGDLEKAMAGGVKIDRGDIVDFLKGFREVLRPLFARTTVGITPDYRTEVVETPPYLVNFIPTAAMSPFNAFTDEPYNYFFVTTDEARSPPVGLGDLFQLIVHEEYGHCVNFSNSASGFAASPGKLELLPSQLSLPISDGISFFRELESLRLLEDIRSRMDSGGRLERDEEALVDFVSGRVDFGNFLAEVRLIVYRWRMVRFLRALGDVRINMHTDTYTTFLKDAVEATGLEPRLVHDQLFIFQRMVGYAPSYSVGGQSLRYMQKELADRGVPPRIFNTIASSMGFSPRRHFEGELRRLCLETRG